MKLSALASHLLPDELRCDDAVRAFLMWLVEVGETIRMGGKP